MQDPTPSEELIIAYLHGELTEVEKLEVEHKLKTDKEFSALFETYRLTDSSLRSLQKVHSSDVLTAKILQNIHKHSDETHKQSQPFKIFIFAVAAVLFLSLGYHFILLQMPPSDKVSVDKDFAKNNLIQNNGKNSAEYAALDWLKNSQSKNGAWDGEVWGAGSQYTIGLTGLSLLAYASSGQCTNENYKSTVTAATNYLISTQNKDGSFGPSIANRLYNQGIATVALLKIRQNCQSLVPEQNIKLALQNILESQNMGGGWSYTNEKNAPNSSISIWQIHSLMLAKQLGFENLDDDIQKNIAWLQNMTNDKGVIGYRKASDYPFGQNTLVAMSSIFWLYEDNLNIQSDDAAIEYKIRFREDLEKIALDPDKNLNYYQFYFLTSALQKLKEKHQFELAKKVENLLLAKQIKTGNQYGSWDPNDYWGPTGGRVYSTAMATISLASLSK